MSTPSDDPTWCNASTSAAAVASSSAAQIEILPAKKGGSRFFGFNMTTCVGLWCVLLLIGGLFALVNLRGTPISPMSPSGFVQASVDAQELTRQCRQSLQSAKDIASTIREQAPGSIDELLEQVNSMDIALGFGSFAYLLSEVSPHEAVRDAATECFLSLDKFTTELYLDRSVYDRAVAFSAAAASDQLAQRRYRKFLNAFERSGIGLETLELRDQAKNLSNALDELSTAFEHRLAADMRSFTFDPTVNAILLSGLDPDFVAAHTNVTTGFVTITTDYPDAIHISKYSKSAWLRKKMHTLSRERGAPGNLATLKEVLEKRWNFAKLLGWSHFADYITANKMISNAAKADQFTRSVANLTKADAEREIGKLRELKRIDLGLGADVDIPIEAFDYSFYSTQLRERDYALNASEIRQYLRYANTRNGVLWAAGKLFHVTFVNVTGSVATWHPEVEVYDVHWRMPTDGSSATGGHSSRIGRIYLDMHPRPDKYKHAAQFTMRDGVMGVHLPEACLVTNFPATGPMEHSQVTTFFHECVALPARE